MTTNPVEPIVGHTPGPWRVEVVTFTAIEIPAALLPCSCPPPRVKLGVRSGCVHQRFARKVRLVGDCWQFTVVGGNGYGTFHVDGLRVNAHRWSYRAFIGEVPDGLELDHLCRNRACANPLHLEPVTRRENIMRGAGPERKRLQALANTHCKLGHERTGANRTCLVCKTAGYRRRKEAVA